MSRYRKIEVRIWNDEKFRALSSDAKLVFFFLLTHPQMTSLGAMRATAQGLAAELGTLSEGFPKAFHELISKGMAEYDESASCVALPNFLRYNQPESPNVVKSWLGVAEQIPECALKVLVLQRAESCVQTLAKGFGEALPEGFRKGMANPEPITRTHNSNPIIPPTPKGGKASKPAVSIPDCLNVPEFIEAWDSWTKHRRERKSPLTPTCAASQLRKLADLGPARAVETLKNSTTQGWLGLFEPGANRPGGEGNKQSGLDAMMEGNRGTA